MRLIISLILAVLMVSCATPPARSQSGYQVVAACGTIPVAPAVGAVRTGYMDQTGQICSVAPVGSGGATAANQVLQITQETAVNTVLGLLADAAATPGSTGSISAKARLLTASKAPVAPAAATATQADLVGCQATTAAVNPTTGQQGACSSDTNNNILVSSGGAPNLLTSQVSVATSDTSVAAARALRRSITVQQITGTQQVYCSNTTATSANGVLLPAVVGASVTLNTTSAVRCIALVGAQTVAVAETF